MSRPFSYNTGSRVGGTLKIQNLTVGGTASTQELLNSGLQWWNGADESQGFAVIAKTVPSGTQPTPVVGPNEILDPTLSGAVGGSLPTGWNVTFPTGVTATYGAVQTSGGISYFDIVVTGSRTGGSAFIFITTTGTTGPQASQNQTWGSRYWMAGVTGSIPGLAIQTLELQNTTTLGTSTFNIIPTTDLKLYVGSRTFTNASTNRAISRIAITTPTSQSLNFTLRVGSPIFGLQQLASVGFNRAANQAQFLQMSAQLSGSNPATDDAAVRDLNANNCWTNYNPAITSNLILSLDAANAASYPGSGTEWWNLVSVQGGSSKADLFNVPSYSSGRFDFNGTDEYAQTPSNVTASQWSVEAWFKTGASLNNKTTSIVSALVSGGDIAFSLGNYDSAENFLDIGFFKSGNWVTSGFRITPTVGEIYQLVGTYDGSTLSFYQKGAFLGSNSVGVAPAFASPVIIALSGNPGEEADYFFNGSIYIIRIYSSALNSGDVLKNWNANKDRFGL